MSTEHIDYEGYTIAAKPSRVEDSDRWSAVLTITRGSGEDQESWLVSASDIYESRKDALARCFDFARELIDREMKGCSLD
jgi:hypothetical protein